MPFFVLGAQGFEEKKMSESFGPYQGELHAEFDAADARAQLADFGNWLATASLTPLSEGGDQVVLAELVVSGRSVPVALKLFKRQGRLKDWYDQRQGSKAARAYHYAEFLNAQALGTATPVAFLDRWDQGRLIESYFLSVYTPAMSFKEALIEIYRDVRDNEALMNLLNTVAPAVRALHDAGFMHGDLGNQNILVPRSDSGDWLAPLFIDLNRSKQSSQPLSDREKGHDLARIKLPGKYLAIFQAIYNHGHDLPQPLAKAALKARRRFWAHRRRSRWRHPLRHAKYKRRQDTPVDYPSDRDLWLWDEKTAQPMVALSKAEKWQSRYLADGARGALRFLAGAPSLFMAYRQQLALSYSKPVVLKDRIGVALHPHDDYLEAERNLLSVLGDPPVLVRFCHHESSAQWQAGIRLIEQLHRDGVQVMASLLQDRRAVLDPESWQDFLTEVVAGIGDKVFQVEITHAINRAKWGVWSRAELHQLMTPVLALQRHYPSVRFVGPGCIDFEYLPVISALADLPEGLQLDGLSHLLYVDRRGAPENKQGRFSTLEKAALLKAVAEQSARVASRVVVSEVNWPILGTGVWSPVACPYETAAQRQKPFGASEEDYADFMVRFLALTLCSGHVDQVFWWRLSAHGYGIVDDRDEFRQRPAFHALKFFLALLGDATFVKKRSIGEGCYFLEFQKEGHRLAMVWQTTPSPSLTPAIEIAEGWDVLGGSIETFFMGTSPTYYRLPDLKV